LQGQHLLKRPKVGAKDRAKVVAVGEAEADFLPHQHLQVQ
jgi:hypothetical protein